MKTVVRLLTLLLLPLLAACQDDTPQPQPPKAALDAAQQVAAVADANNGRKVYESFCASCHATGLMHAPKFGDREAWAEHSEHGMQHMVENAIRGVGSMPPRGGNPRLSDEDIRAAVEHMVENSR